MMRTSHYFLLSVVMVSSSAYAMSLAQVEYAAKHGNAQAEADLGADYYSGQGVPQSCDNSIYWIRKSAEQGNGEGENNMGVYYHEGYCVPREYRKAFYWYRKAAKRGNALAEYNLGQNYYSGLGVTANLNEAVYWYQKAAKQGEPLAEKALSIIQSRYYAGDVVDPYVHAGPTTPNIPGTYHPLPIGPDQNGYSPFGGQKPVN